MKLGFIGTGRITDSHLATIRRVWTETAIDVLGFYSPREVSRAAMCARWGGKSFESAEQLLDARPDAVFITSPTPFHAEQAIMAADRGIPIYLEKPVARTPDEYAAVQEAVERADVINCVGVQWRYRPQTEILRTILRDNPATLVVGQWYWFTPPVAWLRDRAQGGGQVFDQLVHLIDLAHYVLGDVTSVFAHFGSSPNNRYSDFANWDVYSLSLTYASGCIGSYTSTYRLNVPLDDRVTLDFVSGDHLARYKPDGLHLWNEAEVRILPETGLRGLDMVGRDHITRAFLGAVRTGNPDGIVSTIDDVDNTMRVLFGATESALARRAVSIGGATDDDALGGGTR